MNDPIGAFDAIRGDFVRYIKTAFKTQFRSLEAEREAMLNRTHEDVPGIFFRDPWVEPLPAYESGVRLSELDGELAGMSAPEKAAFRALAASGLTKNHPLYQHQLSMLQLSRQGRNAVVTAGTGSGKTEAFLLPLFAALAAESTRWVPPGPRRPHQDDWWTPANAGWRTQQIDAGVSPRIPQRINEGRTAAVRALIMYPMNALVEDQMTRLRRALDSDAARAWCDRHANGNRIYLGRYNGGTPVPGHERQQNGGPNERKLGDLVAELQHADEAAVQVTEHIRQAEGGPVSEEDKERVREYRFFFPRLDGAEMRSRWDMQDAPPDILITNNSMLSIMMMRADDDGIFDRTARWLLESPQNVFHLIIDELHLYRGTAGTEVAYLLRLLLLRLGLNPTHPQLRILASSASLDPEKPESAIFLRDFFGCPWTRDQIVMGRSKAIPAPRTGRLPSAPFAGIAAARVEERNAAIETAVRALGAESPAAAFSAVAANVALACSATGTVASMRATPISQVAERVFAPGATAEELRQALRGLFILRAAAGAAALPSYRFHWFFRNIEGLWACVAPRHCHELDADDPRTAGKVFASARIHHGDSRQGLRRVLELLYCEVCGTTMFGGARLALANNAGWEMLNTDHDIEGIPDRRAARFVDRRNYADYAVFWPKGRDDLNPDVPARWTPHSLADFAAGRGTASWSEASLDPVSGRVALGRASNSQISGFLFHVVRATPDEQSGLAALPGICPSCASSYLRRLGRRSPVRGFRTGFSKVSQILAKELFYELPERDRKLVVFSDSREDAATMANGIERNHYDDLVREAIYDELLNDSLGECALTEDLATADRPFSATALAYSARHPTAVNRIREEVEISRSPVPPGLRPAAQRVLEEARDSATAAVAARRERWRKRIVPAGTLLRDPTDPLMAGTLVARLKRLGVNPAGMDVDYQDFSFAPRDYRRWTELFDFSSPDQCWQVQGASAAVRNAREQKFLPKVAAEISSVLFSRNYFSFESCGLGYPQLRLDDAQIAELAREAACDPQVFWQACHGVVRKLGDAFFYVDQSKNSFQPDAVPGPGNLRASIRHWIQAVADTVHADPILLRDTLWKAVTDSRYGGHTSALLQLERIDIRIAQPDDEAVVCRTCRRPHLHPAGGICTWCLNPLTDPIRTNCLALRTENYYAAEAASGVPPIRMHCEELSAQTDDQGERQRLFRDIVIRVGGAPLHAAVDTIDLLSVTTTMEVGVDIGALQAVMLANMPPMRFNYQQRVGRAGRRGQAFAVVLTVCRGRSHDEHYYNAPARITGDPPPVPFLSLGRPEIVQRLAAKECLRRAFRAAGVTTWDSPVPPDSHGEFGTVQMWTDRPAVSTGVSQWLAAAADVNQIAAALTDGDATASSALATVIRGELHARVLACIADDALGGQGIAQRLAEGAALPMFGMPSRTRQLYHSLHDRIAHTIDRDLDLAVSEFAPGSQKTKDKRVYTSIGFTPPLIQVNGRWQLAPTSALPWRRWMMLCSRCNYTETVQNRPIERRCLNPNCTATIDDPQQPFRIFEVAAPAAFRTNFGRGENARVDMDTVFSGSSSLAEESAPDAPVQAVLNSELTFDRQGRVYRLNDRNRRLFRGGLGQARPYRGLTFTDQWIDERFQNLTAANERQVLFVPTGQVDEIGLVAPKRTDVLRIRPASVPAGVSCDLLNGGVGAKAAFYSAAFILRSVAADLLDIDSEEIVVSNVRAHPLQNGVSVGEIILNDHLPNGAGFVAWTRANWSTVLNAALFPAQDGFARTMLSPAHAERCETACPDCLRHYRNMPFHGLLDWRLGIAVVRLLSDPAFQCGLAATTAPELGRSGTNATWLESASGLRDVFCAAFPRCQPQAFGPLPGFVLAGRNVIVVHPLWNHRSPHGILADAVTAAGGTPLFVDTFNLSRRMSWIYQALAANLGP